MNRRIAHFSCGAASAVAAKLSKPDEIWYANTGGEDEDNMRFLRDCEQWFGQEVRILRSEKYASTWELWDKKRYLSGVAGAPCTGELKLKPLRAAGRPDDIGIIGYTADTRDRMRVKQLRAMKPDAIWEFPLIEAGLTKAACLGLERLSWLVPEQSWCHRALGLERGLGTRHKKPYLHDMVLCT